LVERSTKTSSHKEKGPKLPTDSRAKILEAAFAALSRDGYENVSIKDIAEEAGVAQGLVHYYFKSKQQLVLAVLFEVCKKMDVYTAEGTEGAMAAFENFKVLLRTQPDAHTLYIQLIGVGLHDKEIGAGIRENIRTERGHVEDIARQVLAERETDPRPARAIASAVWAGVLGIMVSKSIDPEFDADEAVDALAAMALHAVYPSGQATA
jgi:AcrR family transcriptional regulator